MNILVLDTETTISNKEEEIRKYKQDYYLKNREKYLKRQTDWFRDNPKKRLLQCSKVSAKEKKLFHSLVEEDIVIPEYCPLLGTKITNIVGEGKKDTNPSIDRIDSSKGYTKDNIQIVSDLANRMKNSATKEQLISFSINILKKYASENLSSGL